MSKFIVETDKAIVVRAYMAKTVKDALQLQQELEYLDDNDFVLFQGKSDQVTVPVRIAHSLSQVIIEKKEQEWIDSKIKFNIIESGILAVNKHGKLTVNGYQHVDLQGLRFAEDDEIRFFYY